MTTTPWDKTPSCKGTLAAEALIEPKNHDIEVHHEVYTQPSMPAIIEERSTKYAHLIGKVNTGRECV